MERRPGQLGDVHQPVAVHAHVHERAEARDVRDHALERHSLLRDVEFLPNITREEKIAFLKSLSVLSVPAAYSESFGLYVVEAMAAGVPVVGAAEQVAAAGVVEQAAATFVRAGFAAEQAAARKALDQLSEHP